MRDDKKQMRHRAIANAAYDLLAQKGYDGTSMLSVAKAAKASNETLYRWYGDKRGLFEALVRDNTADVEQILRTALHDQKDAITTLRVMSPVLLSMLLGERAILLNRAAAADPTGTLGRAISAGGRDVVQPLVAALMTKLAEQHPQSAETLMTLFLNLLIGDLQIKRVIGVLPALSQEQIAERTQTALSAFEKLLQS